MNIAQMPDVLTNAVAADLLCVSRPTLLRWTREGMIDCFKVGPHARSRRTDVLRLREEHEAQRRAAFQKLRELDADNDFEFFTD